MTHSTPFNWRSTTSTLTLLFIMFIDGVGMSLVLPLIGDLFAIGPHSIISASTSGWLTNVYYGGSLACFSGAMIIGAVVLGQLSDKSGRKFTLYLSLGGAVIGYLICAFAVFASAPMLFLLGRTIDGLTAGSIPVAQAMLSDVDTRQNKMTSIAKVMFALTSGYMFGPIIASIAFSSKDYSFYLPFLLVALCCVVCMVLLGLIQDTSEIKKADNKIDLTIAFRQIKALWQAANLRNALVGFFLFQCAWTLFYQYLPKMNSLVMSLSESNSSLLMTEVGIGMCFAFCFVVPKMQALCSPKRLVIYCVSLFSLAAANFLISMGYLSFQVISVLMSILYAVGYSAMLAFMLSISNENQKGLIFGSIASICAISATATALLGSTIACVNYRLFFMVLFILSVMVLVLFTKNTSETLVETV